MIALYFLFLFYNFAIQDFLIKLPTIYIQKQNIFLLFQNQYMIMYTTSAVPRMNLHNTGMRGIHQSCETYETRMIVKCL